ncbi:DUF3786 domain-containing protein [Chloroflexota bacterium]
MGSNQLTLSIKKHDVYGYELAHELACEKLAEIKDLEAQCRKTDARYQTTRKIISLRYLSQSYLITFPGGEVSLADKEADVPLRDKILILHYFTQAKGTPLANKLISFKELPEGTHYFPTFYLRAIKSLVGCFGKEPHRLPETAKTLDGRKADYGDAAVTVNAFSRVPITLVLWKGDNEFPPEGSIMFDSTIPDYLPTEDIIVLCETTIRRLVKATKE